jgi:hypothetical protein
MDTMTLAITFRSIERIVAVAIGGVSIYLGYRLFIAVPLRRESEGKVVLPGDISIYLSKIGPGAFFALFGAIVVAVSFQQSITYREGFGKSPEESEQSQPASSKAASYIGFGSADPANRALESRRLQVEADIRFLETTLPQALKKDLRTESRTDVNVLVPRLKLALVHTVWDSQWGDFGRFRQWVETGAAEPPPTSLATPAALYHGARQ